MRTYSSTVGLHGVLILLVGGLAVSPASPAAMATMHLGLSQHSAPDQAGDKPIAYVLETSGPPKIDGTLGDEAWSKALPFKISRTIDGSGQASQATEVRLLRDAQNLYVGVRCAEPRIDRLQAAARNHDGDIWGDDSIEFFLSAPDSGTYYHFGVNTVGSSYDGQERNAAWNSDFTAAACKGKDYWTMTCSIPLAKLQSRAEPLTHLSGNFHRNRYAGGKLEEWAWSPTYSGDSHVPEKFGELKFGAPQQQVKTGDSGPKRIEFLNCDGGQGVVRFDLSALPKNARIYRADLLVARERELDGANDEIMTAIDIEPLFNTLSGGATEKLSKALELRAPWFDRFDATEVVRKWAGGDPNGGFFVKRFPLWRRDATALEIYYEGHPEHPPEQVHEVKAFHHAGQTFITWKEIDDPVGKDVIQWKEMRQLMEKISRQPIRYAIYRHSKPITAETLPEAQLLALVKPASCWNVNGRNVEEPIDRFIATQYVLINGHWNPFCGARIDGDFGKDCIIERLVIKNGQTPLERGTGLYVHTAAEEGDAYYAVVTVLDGVQNSVDFSERNTTSVIHEIKSPGEPVLQKEFPKEPYFNYREQRLHYVRWEAPPFVNVPSEYYNWSVALPQTEETKDAKPGSLPLELNLPPDDRSYQRTHYRIESDSVVITPHDFPIVTWWYGYHEALGTLKSFTQGNIQPYTERRLLSFIDWAAAKWPIDRNHTLVTARNRNPGGSGPGGYRCATNGALHLAIRHPEVFCAVMTGYYGSPDYSVSPHALQLKIWGSPNWGMKTDTGQSVWDELDLNKYVAGLPIGMDLPFTTHTGGKAPKEELGFLALLLERGQPLAASFGEFGAPGIIPVSAACTWPGSVIRSDVCKNSILPSFGRLKADAVRNLAKPYIALNMGYRWKDVVDLPDRVEITLQRESKFEDLTTDVTLRRLQSFKTEPGKAYAWRNCDMDGKEIDKGDLTIGKDGLLTVEKVKILEAGNRLVVKKL